MPICWRIIERNKNPMFFIIYLFTLSSLLCTMPREQLILETIIIVVIWLANYPILTIAQFLTNLSVTTSNAELCMNVAENKTISISFPKPNAIWTANEIKSHQSDLGKDNRQSWIKECKTTIYNAGEAKTNSRFAATSKQYYYEPQRNAKIREAGKML